MRSIHSSSVCAAAMAASLVIGVGAWGECPVVDFDNYPVGTLIYDQYPGVRFYAVVGGCGMPGDVRPMIIQPGAGTSSGSRALSLETGCPDFSPDYLLFDFDPYQQSVSFTVGEPVTPGIDVQVIGYNQTFQIMFNQTFECGEGVHRMVHIEAGPGEQIRRVVVFAPGDWFECIDDLQFGQDTTPPTARIDYPAHNDCVCDDGYVTVTGVACDEDGEYGYDKLEYRRTGSGDPWTLVGTYTSPVCTSSSLYSWDVSGLSHGRYDLMLTVENECGMVSTDVVWAYVDKQFSEVEIVSPAQSETVCGVVEIEGSVSDGCRMCFVQYTVRYATSIFGPWYDVDPSQPIYDEVVINGRLATWDLAHLPGGGYLISVAGLDECGNTAAALRTVTVDHGTCTECAGDVDGNSVVNVVDLLELLGNWGACGL